MDTRSPWTDPRTLAFLWPPIFLAWVLALYRISNKVDSAIWIAMTAVLAFMVVNVIWIVADQVREEQPDEAPWYLLIGGPRSGKATLVQNAGSEAHALALDMEISNDPYFPAHSLVLGQHGIFVLYREEDIGQSTHHELADQVERFLHGKPLKGVLVTLSVEGREDAAALARQAGVLRERIRTLLDRLGIEAPVYLIVTKCDLLPGFDGFFADLTSVEQQGGWGAMSADGRTGNPGKTFDAECQILHQALGDRRLARLGRGDIAANADIYRFPMAFTQACVSIRAFVEGLFAPPGRLFCRGFCFTAVMPRPAPQAASSYFVNGVLTTLLANDRGLARPSGRAKRQLWLARLTLLVASFIISAALLLPLSHVPTLQGAGYWRSQDCGAAGADCLPLPGIRS